MAIDPGPRDRPQDVPRREPALALQVVSGAGLLVLLTLHMVAQHLVVTTGLRRYQDVLDWLRTPLVVVLEIAFLVFVTYHALLGLRAILFELGFGERAERLITQLLWVAGGLTVVYGVALLVAIVNAAPS